MPASFGRIAATALAGLAIAAPAAALAAGAPVAPRLIVAISVDQFGANLFAGWRSRFTGGLGRLVGGVVYPSGYQTHAATETCPGHSTLLTGKHPNKTGIVGNDYRDPDTGKQIYCLQDRTVTRAEGGAAAPVGPGRLMATTMGDWLKAASPQSRVVAVSGKDRGAITMAGHDPDGVFWLAPGFGYTTYLRAGETAAVKLKPVAAINTRIARTWTVRPTWSAAHKDCRALGGDWKIGDVTWTSQLPPKGWGESAKPADINRDVLASPLNDELTAAAARDLIDYYRLGRGPAVDLLAISFSATDTVGHRYGSDGPEMCEQMHRLDAAIGSVLAKLDAVRTPYVVVLSADHGGSDFAARLQAKGYSEAKVVDGRGALDRANKAVMARFNLAAPPLSGTIDEVYIDTPPGVDKAQLEAAAAVAVAAQPEVAAAFTQTELLATPIPVGKTPDELTLKERFAESAYPGRSADVLAALQPYTVGRSPMPGTYLAGHGTPWNYDRRVPILFWWPGATAQERPLPVETVDIAPTLAAMVGLPPPADIDGRCRPLAVNRCP